MSHSPQTELDELFRKVKRWFNLQAAPAAPPSSPEPPEDPYSYVGAPKKPRPPTRSAGAAVDPER